MKKFCVAEFLHDLISSLKHLNDESAVYITSKNIVGLTRSSNLPDDSKYSYKYWVKKWPTNYRCNEQSMFLNADFVLKI